MPRTRQDILPSEVSLTRWMAAVALCTACGGDREPRECDAGTPTCDSSLIISFPDDRTRFLLEVTDDLGMDLTIDCPDEDTGLATQGGYTWTCGAGRVTIDAHVLFGATVEVGIGATPPKAYTPDYQRGGDFCGNSCNIGTIDL